jgi:hypothetical protein
MTHALARLLANISRRRPHMSVHPKPRNAYLTNFFYTPNSIDVCTIEKPPYTTGVCKIRAHKGNIKGIKNIRVHKLTRQTLHKPQHWQSSSNRINNMPSKRHLYYCQVIDRVNTIKDDTTQHVGKFNRMT